MDTGNQHERHRRHSRDQPQHRLRLQKKTVTKNAVHEQWGTRIQTEI